jgi:hypothetical protein
MVTMGVERFISRPLVQLLWLIAALLVAVEALGRSMGPGSIERTGVSAKETGTVNL